MQNRSKVSIIIAAILLCVTGLQASALKTRGVNTAPTPYVAEMGSNLEVQFDSPVFRAEFTDSFERAAISPWTSAFEPTGGSHNFAIRDTLDTYGPGTCANSGYQFPGYPGTDISQYINVANPGKRIRLTSPTVDISGWSACFLSFYYWLDSEGVTDNFDGAYVEISSDNGVTWQQIDSLAEGHLDPTYDDTLLYTGQSGGMYAWCYDRKFWRNVVSQNLMALGYVAAGNQVQIRFTFDRDAQSGGQGFFIDDVKLSTDAPPDHQAPVITHTPLSDTVDTLNPYTIAARVVDYGAGVDPDSVYLFYKIESGSYIGVKMTSSSGDTFTANIPKQPWHTDVYYYIEATDLASPPNSGVSAECYFEVTNAITIIYDDGQPWWAIGGLANGDGVYNLFTFSDVGVDSAIVHKVLFYFNDVCPVEIQFYDFEFGWPGALLDSIKGLTSSPNGWNHFDYTDLTGETLKVYGPDAQILAGHIVYAVGPDTLVTGADPTQEHPQNMWGYIGSAWSQAFTDAGDLMIRLKILKLPLPIPGTAETPSDLVNVNPDLSYSMPNPMTNSTMIEYSLPVAQDVSLRIYDVSGKLIKNLVNARKEAGTHRITWNGKDESGNMVASGIYFYQLQSSGKNITRKLIVTR
jgi:hypothetical protein